MERTYARFQHRSLGNIAAFSLVELLIGLAISSILALGLWSLASVQERTYGTQDSSSEMQQNLRVAVQRLTRDIVLSGLGPRSSTIGGQDASAWYNAANNWVPYNITTASLDIIGQCGLTVANLSSQAASGTNTLSLATGQGANFSVSQNICIAGAENAVVQSIAGDILTLSSNLTLTHPSEAAVYPLQWVTYSVQDGVLNINQHDGNGAQPVAGNIASMTITASAVDPKALTVALTATNGSANAPVTSSVTDTVYRRNN